MTVIVMIVEEDVVIVMTVIEIVVIAINMIVTVDADVVALEKEVTVVA
ncbi:hypothetical protein [Gottfriedia luciferensis]|nr:hypothetical protein [Gottfriedia luciferensis]